MKNLLQTLDSLNQPLTESSAHSQDALSLNPDLAAKAKKPSLLSKVGKVAKNAFFGKSDEEMLQDLERETGGLRPAYRADTPHRSVKKEETTEDISRRNLLKGFGGLAAGVGAPKNANAPADNHTFSPGIHNIDSIRIGDSAKRVEYVLGPPDEKSNYSRIPYQGEELFVQMWIYKVNGSGSYQINMTNRNVAAIYEPGWSPNSSKQGVAEGINKEASFDYYIDNPEYNPNDPNSSEDITLRVTYQIHDEERATMTHPGAEAECEIIDVVNPETGEDYSDKVDMARVEEKCWEDHSGKKDYSMYEGKRTSRSGVTEATSMMQRWKTKVREIYGKDAKFEVKKATDRYSATRTVAYDKNGDMVGYYEHKSGRSYVIGASRVSGNMATATDDEMEKKQDVAEGKAKHGDGKELYVGIEAYGVKGMKSTPWRKRFKSQEAFEKWLDSTEGDVEVKGTREVNLNDTSIKEGKKKTKTGVVHKATKNYTGDAADTDEKKTEVKKGRGRPKKNADSESGEEKKWDTSALSGVFGGKQPKNAKKGTVVKGKAQSHEANKDKEEVEGNKPSSKAKLKDWMEYVQKTVIAESGQISMAPVQSGAQDIKVDNKKVGTVSNPQTASQLKTAIDKGDVTLDAEELEGLAEQGDEPMNKVKKIKTMKESHDKLSSFDRVLTRFPHEHKQCQEGMFMDEGFYQALAEHYFEEGKIPRQVWVRGGDDLREMVESLYSEDTQMIQEYDLDNAGSGVVAPMETSTEYMIGDSMFESKKDAQMESWDKQLSALLTEGLTVTTTSGSEGAADSVSVSATDADAHELMQILQGAGLTSAFAGGSSEEEHSTVEPVSSDEVMTQLSSEESDDSGDSALDFLKKMISTRNGEMSQGEESSEEDSEEEVQEGDVEEGNAFSGAVAKAKADGVQPGEKINVGDEEYPVKEESEESEEAEETETSEETEEEKVEEGMETCHECGLMESDCECDHEEEQLNEWANSPEGNKDDAGFNADIEFMTKVLSGGINGPKRDQSVLPHTQVNVDSNSMASILKKLENLK